MLSQEVSIPDVNPNLMLSAKPDEVADYLTSVALKLYKNGLTSTSEISGKGMSFSLPSGNHPDIASMLRTYCFTYNASAREAYEKAIIEALKPLNDSEKLLLQRFKADLDMLMVQADGIARANYLRDHAEERTKTPLQMVRMLSNKIKPDGTRATMNDVIDWIVAAKQEKVLTSHPTNTNEARRIAALKKVSDICFFNGREEGGDKKFEAAPLKKLDAAVAEFLSAEAIPKTNLTPIEEAELNLYFADNHFDSLAYTHEPWEAALTEVYGDEYDKQARARFYVPTIISDWAALDKDGNPNITSEITRKVVLMHAQRITTSYQKMFYQCNKAFGLNGKIPDGLGDDVVAIGKILNHWVGIESNKVAAIDAVALEEAVTKLYNNPKIDEYPEVREIVLNLKRAIRTFGATLAWGEYRENSKAILDTAQFVLNQLTDAQFEKVTGLNKEAFLATADKSSIYTQAFSKILKGEFDGEIDFGNYAEQAAEILKSLPCDAPEEIRYTTLERIEIALLNPTIIKKHVLAETEGVHNVMALEFLKKCVENKLKAKGHNVTADSLGCVPLYEDVNVMAQVPKFTEETLQRPEMLEALVRQSRYRGEEPTFEVQAAQSDTARTGGSTAARYQIYMMHKPFYEVCKKYGFIPVVYVGGSQLDPARGGGRAFTSQIKLYGYERAKYTVQGLDNLAVSNCIYDITRHSEVVLLACLNNTHKSRAELMGGHSEEAMEIIDALTKEFGAVSDVAYQTYVKEFFIQPTLHVILAQLFNYASEMAAGNASSRPSKRLTKGSEGEETEPLEINPGVSRAISFAEAVYSKGVNLLNIDSAKSEKIILEVMFDPDRQDHNPKLQSFLKLLKEKCVKENRVYEAEALRILYTDVPVSKEIIDRMGFGNLSDYDFLWNHSQGLRVRRDEEGLITEKIVERPKPAELDRLAPTKNLNVNGMLSYMENQYRKSAEMVYTAMTGRIPPWKAETATRDIRAFVIDECIPHFAEYARNVGKCLRINDIFVNSIRGIPEKAMARKLAHNMNDTATFLMPKKCYDSELSALQTNANRKPPRGLIDTVLTLAKGIF